ncbi:transposase [Desulfosarcina widdelii]|uniref:transposase n=1 Tax=Desulfosarcina widdelii TaxID=947919 RepID=UPI0012D32DE0
MIDKEQFRREITNQSKSKDYEKLYGANLVTTLIKRLIRGTYQGRFEPKYLQNYLYEYVFRFNRRKSKSIGKKFMRIVQQALKTPQITWPKIPWDLDPLSEYFATTGVS